MGIRIKQLSPGVANQIAAGEVIERPASVVKELLENALDAGATIINIEVTHGGLNHIRISDNGAGILAEDLPLAIAAHATSKISQLDDLYLLDSMGFRGEALASIASIAKLSITSKPKNQEHAMCLEKVGDECNLRPSARNTGTTLDVADLFYNAPVRKKFLKTEKQEFVAIETVVKRFALSAPQIAIQLKHNGKIVLSLPESTSEQTKIQRVAKIFGQAFIKDACYFEVDHGSLRLSGWISGSGGQRSQNDKQWVYINQRMVKDKLLYHAIKQAYEGILDPGRFPACLLYFTIDTREVDVNVHPTKHEVRFQQPRLVHDFFITQLSQALKSASAPLASEKTSGSCIEEQTFYTLKESIPVFHHQIPWIILNSDYGLLFKMGKPNLVDMKTLYYQNLIQVLHKQTLPLAHRPLLVPMRYTLPNVQPHIILSIQSLLRPLGLILEVDESFLKVCSVPVVLPQLDVRKLLDALFTEGIPDNNVMMETLCRYQTFDATQLNIDEKNELYRIMEEVSSGRFYKELTVDDCRKCLELFV